MTAWKLPHNEKKIKEVSAVKTEVIYNQHRVETKHIFIINSRVQGHTNSVKGLVPFNDLVSGFAVLQAFALLYCLLLQSQPQYTGSSVLQATILSSDRWRSCIVHDATPRTSALGPSGRNTPVMYSCGHENSMNCQCISVYSRKQHTSGTLLQKHVSAVKSCVAYLNILTQINMLI